MASDPFKYRQSVERLWPFIDGLARRCWEHLPSDDRRRRQIANKAGELYGGILSASSELPNEPPDTIPEPYGMNGEDKGWEQFANKEIVNLLGSKGVSSVTEAYVKANFLLKVLQTSSGHGKGSFLYRGQRNIAWDLRPRKARALLDSGWTAPNEYLDKQRKTMMLQEELDALTEFQESWPPREVEDEDRAKNLDQTDPSWWFRMQHYDDGDGTRLLDVTNSLNAALLFACVNWSTGLIDESTDGVVYFWIEGWNANVDDYLTHALPESLEGLFSGYPDAPRFVLNPPANERLKAQSGAFIWWPAFWKPPSAQPHFLRVNAKAKADIVVDLLSMGFGPKEAVRGKKGLENEQRLRSQLGYPAWNPISMKTDVN